MKTINIFAFLFPCARSITFPSFLFIQFGGFFYGDFIYRLKKEKQNWGYGKIEKCFVDLKDWILEKDFDPFSVCFVTACNGTKRQQVKSSWS
jgi:hypothetical protein